MSLRDLSYQLNFEEMISKVKEQVKNVFEKNNGKIESNDLEKKVIDGEYVKKLFSFLDNYIKRIETLLSDVKYESYNVQYRNFVEKYFSNVLKNLKNINNDFFVSNSRNSVYNIISELYGYISKNNLLDIYDQFRDSDLNYILFGKNGAGKTTLLKELNSKLFIDNTVIIPATRNINYKNNVYFFGDEKNLFSALNTTDDCKTLFLLNECIRDKSYLELKNGINPNEVATNIATKIFNDLGLDRSIDIDHKDGIHLYNEYNEYYSFSDASDGEKSSLYFIFVTLLSPENSYLFIDEPENHLNGSLMKNLFDMLEACRKDIKFIYATHNIAFIESRNKSNLVYLDKCQKKNEWKYRKINDELPLDLILSIEGNNQDVLFCEGNNESLDLRVYSILFPNYEIKSLSGCESVINHTKLINEYSTIFKKNAYGIVDNDFKTVDKIEELKKDRIYALSLNEIENIFLIKECLEKAIKKIGSQKTIDEITNVLFETANHQKNAILSDYSTKLLRTLHLKNKITNVANIEQEIDSINASNRSEFLALFENFKSNLNDAINNRMYYELLKIVPGKILLPRVISSIGYSDKKLFCNNILNNIDEQLKNTILAVIDVNI